MALWIAIILLSSLSNNCNAFIPIGRIVDQQRQQSSWIVQMATTGEEKAAPLISGADLEVMLADLDTPLVIDAYATWYGTVELRYSFCNLCYPYDSSIHPF